MADDPHPVAVAIDQATAHDEVQKALNSDDPVEQERAKNTAALLKLASGLWK